jgi:quinol monooxygenase YgiN
MARRLSSMAAGAADQRGGGVVYFIVVKFQTRPEWTDRWMDLVQQFTESTRAEPGNLWFEWSRSLDDEHTFVLVEAFTDDGAGPHVNSEHFAQAMKDLPQALASTPQIVSRQVEGQGWDRMGELSID